METFSISNRRYLGSKQQLLDFIDEIITNNTKNCLSFTDLFAGTAVVSDRFKDRFELIINDTLSCNYHAYICFFSNLPYNEKKIDKLIKSYNTEHEIKASYYSQNFKDTYLSKESLRSLDFIRDDIENKFENGKINQREYSILITSLIYAIDKTANTVGHYDAFRKNGDKLRNMKLKKPYISKAKFRNQIFNLDANTLIRQIKTDILYLDPPYNSRQYCDAYHFLENVATHKQPKVYGVARKMDRTRLKSKYCLNNAREHFSDLISNADAKYILLSYNNTITADPRSNTKMSDNDIFEILSKKGKVSIFEKDFVPFNAGKSNIQEHKERIFFCEVSRKSTTAKQINLNIAFKRKISQSPLNYTGGKFKLLEQIFPKIPENIDTFYDIFCGGFNVGANFFNAKKVIGIDNNKPLIELLNFIKNSSDLENKLDELILYYNLSQSSKHGYEFYNTTSDAGLCKHNKDGFTRLKADYNTTKNPILFLLLIIFSFNNQIRFNSSEEFNLPVGKRDFNAKLRAKLNNFVKNIQNADFLAYDFRDLTLSSLKQNDFVYLDPPYLLGTATYNENNGWNKKDEAELLDFLSKINTLGVRFAMSNVLEHKVKTNDMLLKWCLENGFNIIHLDKSYANSSYQTKHKDSISREVLIMNF